MRNCLLALILIANFFEYSFGQTVARSIPSSSDRGYGGSSLAAKPNKLKVGAAPRKDTMMIATGKSIPTPTSILNLVGFLRDGEIAAELALDASQKMEITALLDQTFGQPAVVELESGRAAGITTEEIRDFARSTRNQREILVNEILDPLQRDRLEQVVRQIEISRVGLATAILEGFLGEDAGVQEFEKPALKILFDAIKEQYDKEFAAINKEAQQEVMSLLTEEQRAQIPRLMGRPFELIEEPIDKLSRLSEEDINGVVPDPKSLFDSCILLKNQSVVNELKLSDEQLSLSPHCSDFRKSRRLDKKFSDKKYVETYLRSSFDLPTQERLRQIVYQLEVSRRGFGFAVADGYLGKAISIEDSQRTKIKATALEIESKAKVVLDALEDATRKKMLSNLTNTQRQNVAKLLGKPFYHQVKK